MQYGIIVCDVLGPNLSKMGSQGQSHDRILIKI